MTYKTLSRQYPRIAAIIFAWYSTQSEHQLEESTELYIDMLDSHIELEMLLEDIPVDLLLVLATQDSPRMDAVLHEHLGNTDAFQVHEWLDEYWYEIFGRQ